jgi:hypothetical protein
VTDDTTNELQILIDRLRWGDDAARLELLRRAHDRVLKIAATVFRQDFPALQGRHDLESVVSEVWMRLVGALETTRPETVEGFLMVLQRLGLATGRDGVEVEGEGRRAREHQRCRRLDPPAE